MCALSEIYMELNYFKNIQFNGMFFSTLITCLISMVVYGLPSYIVFIIIGWWPWWVFNMLSWMFGPFVCVGLNMLLVYGLGKFIGMIQNDSI